MTESRDFIQFQKWFKYYQKKLGLTNYMVYFKYESLEGAFAEIDVQQDAMMATVRVNSTLLDKDKPFKNTRSNALHEAVHLLVGRLADRAYSRCVQRNEIYETIEELVRRIEVLIDG